MFANLWQDYRAAIVALSVLLIVLFSSVVVVPETEQAVVLRFGQPIRVIFEPFIIVRREFPSPFDAAPRYSGSSGDKVWQWVYVPIARSAERLASWASVLQRGRIHVYLLYSFGTLLFLLLFLR